MRARPQAKPHLATRAALSRRQCLQGLVAGAALSSLPSWAQDTPIRIVTGFPSGSVVDVLARALAEGLRLELGRSVIVDSRPGASGRLAVEAAKAAKPDGDTLLLVPHGPMTLFPYVFANLRYDPVKDFQPLAQLVSFDFGLATATQVPVSNLAEMKAWVQANPQKASFASPGVGTTPHFLGVQVMQRSGLDMVHVPFKSAGDMVTALMGNQVPFVFTALGDLLEGAKAGKLRLVATSGKSRAAPTPQTPTFREAGIDVSLQGWMGLYAPAGVPAAWSAKVEAAAIKALQLPAVRQAMAAANLSPIGAPGAELARAQAAERAEWAEVVKRSGFSPEG